MKPLFSRHRKFLAKIDHAAVLAALAAAEAGTTGHVRVYVSPRPEPDALEAARRHFLRFGLFHHAQRNAVLLFVAPRSRTYAVLGDEAVHAQAGTAAWEAIGAAAAARFREGDFTGGLVAAIGKAGEVLKAHFPQ
ncbi:MAG: TPM domain-containing protein [Verrucomicrobium sp.]|nr:TPM domain-containing protein [Verrucomicrobium sp.]